MLLSAAVLVPAAFAAAHTTTGAAAFEEPTITAVKCPADEPGCSPGQSLRVTGEDLSRAEKVVFLGRKGRKDNRRATPKATRAHRVVVSVPASARSGRVRVVTSYGSATGPRVKIVARTAVEAAPAPAGGKEGIFPIRARHDYGTETNRFGGGRGHQGQDVFARCGAPLVAALSGKVTMVRFHERAGHYVVVKAADGTSQAYMHLRRQALVSQGERVEAGQPIGEVGDTGRASGCHLHFELWTAPGWYAGGEPIDPLPTLKRWDRTS